MSAIVLQNDIVHYEVLGRGRPVIFLHSWVGSWRYWIPAMQTVSINFRAYALDFWGFGDTAKQSSHYLLGSQVSLLEDFLKEMGIGKVALIGHGLGAVVGLLFTSMHPDQVDRMMAVSLPMNAGQVAVRLRNDNPVVLADWLLGRTPASDAVRIETPKTDQQAIINAMSDLDYLDLAEITRHIKTPTLLVHGHDDPLVNLSGNDDMEQLPELAHSITFEISGHFPMLNETEKFNRLVTDFFSLPSGESPRQLQLKEAWKRRMR